MRPSRASHRRSPGSRSNRSRASPMGRDRESGLLHPIALAAIALLVINDHVLKDAYPSWLTGKLSDVAGMVFFPLLAAALLAPIVRIDRDRLLTACVIATGVGFAAIKLWEPATVVCEHVLGFLQLSPGPVQIVRDPTDLLALVALAFPLWGSRHYSHHSGTDTGDPPAFGPVDQPVTGVLA